MFVMLGVILGMTHAGEAHLRAGEIQFHGIAAGFFDHFCQLRPFFFTASHDGSDDDFGRIVPFEPAQDVQIHLEGILGQLFHIAETGKAGVIFYCVKTGRNLPDFLLADGLVKDAAPSGIECPRHHVVVGADGRRSQEERVLAVDADKVDGKGRERLLLRGLSVLTYGVQQLPDSYGSVIVDTGRFRPLQVGVAA